MEMGQWNRGGKRRLMPLQDYRSEEPLRSKLASDINVAIGICLVCVLLPAIWLIMLRHDWKNIP
jgi:hypothetical protein